MEKGNAVASSSSGAAAAMAQPLPSAPPSYEEAVGLTSAAGAVPGILQSQQQIMQPPTAPHLGAGAPPYPMGPQMPMPIPYAAATTQMPLPSQVTTNQVQVPEVRVIHQHVTVTLGPNPVKMTCPSCRADIKTTTMSDHQPSAHVCCIILCLLGCCLCSCLPYCLSAFLSVHHFCPSCKSYIGTWKG